MIIIFIRQNNTTVKKIHIYLCLKVSDFLQLIPGEQKMKRNEKKRKKARI